MIQPILKLRQKIMMRKQDCKDINLKELPNFKNSERNS